MTTERVQADFEAQGRAHTHERRAREIYDSLSPAQQKVIDGKVHTDFERDSRWISGVDRVIGPALERRNLVESVWQRASGLTHSGDAQLGDSFYGYALTNHGKWLVEGLRSQYHEPDEPFPGAWA